MHIRNTSSSVCIVWTRSLPLALYSAYGVDSLLNYFPNGLVSAWIRRREGGGGGEGELEGEGEGG